MCMRAVSLPCVAFSMSSSMTAMRLADAFIDGMNVYRLQLSANAAEAPQSRPIAKRAAFAAGRCNCPDTSFMKPPPR